VGKVAALYGGFAERRVSVMGADVAGTINISGDVCVSVITREKRAVRPVEIPLRGLVLKGAKTP